jgi:hypothetical protein
VGGGVTGGGVGGGVLPHVHGLLEMSEKLV